MKPNLSKIILFLGCLLLGALCYSVGVANILDSLQKIGLHFFGILVIALGWHVANTYAWHLTLPTYNKVSFLKKIQIKLQAEAFNTLTPFMSSGGEPLRVWLTKNYYSLEDGVASVLIDKVLHFVSGLIFSLMGIFMMWKSLSLNLNLGFYFSIIIFTILGVFVFFYRTKGKLLFLLIKINRVLKSKLINKYKNKMEEIDNYLSRFFLNHKQRFFFSFLFNILGWVLGVVEIFYILYLIGSPVTILNAYMIASFIIILHFFSSFIPSSIGASEGGLYLFFAALGVNPAVGVSLALVRRLRMAFWAATGVLFSLSIRN